MGAMKYVCKTCGKIVGEDVALCGCLTSYANLYGIMLS